MKTEMNLVLANIATNHAEQVYAVGFNKAGEASRHASLAGVIGYAPGKIRTEAAKNIYATQISNGMYRPFINDLLNLSGLVGTQMKVFLLAALPQKGAIPKQKMIDTCNLILNLVKDQSSKKDKSIEELVKGKKLDFYTICRDFIENNYSIENESSENNE